MKVDTHELTFGVVTVLTGDNIVFQGTIVHEEEEKPRNDDPDFIFLKLVCNPGIIRDNAQLKVITPFLYNIGSTVRLNVEEIASIGPSTGVCPADGG